MLQWRRVRLVTEGQSYNSGEGLAALRLITTTTTHSQPPILRQARENPWTKVALNRPYLPPPEAPAFSPRITLLEQLYHPSEMTQTLSLYCLLPRHDIQKPVERSGPLSSLLLSTQLPPSLHTDSTCPGQTTMPL